MHSDAKRYYAILDLPPEASEEAIRTAFRRRAKELHPDSLSGNTSAFIRLKRAYDTLSEPASRADYDRACMKQRRPAPSASAPPPLPLRPGRQRSGIGFARYATAFVFMSALSFGFIEAMIAWTEAPPSAPAFRAGPDLAGPRANRSTAAADDPVPTQASSSEPSDTRPGFWNGEPPAGQADTAKPRRPPADRLGAAPGRW